MADRWRISHLLAFLTSYPLVSFGARVKAQDTNVIDGDGLLDEVWQVGSQYACIQKWKQNGKYTDQYCLVDLKKAYKIAGDRLGDRLRFADMKRCESSRYKHKMKVCPLKGTAQKARMSYSAKTEKPKSCFRYGKPVENLQENELTIRILRFDVLEAVVDEAGCEMMSKRTSIANQGNFAGNNQTVTTSTTTIFDEAPDVVSHPLDRPSSDHSDEVESHDNDVDEEYYKNLGTMEDCVGWAYVGVCQKCLAKNEETLTEATCYQCPAGYVLQRAPTDNAGMSEDNGKTIHMTTHCVKLIGEEKRLIMIRHGESIWNELMKSSHKAATAVGLWVGKDSPLSPLGLRQAQRFASVMKKANRRVYGEVKESDGSEQLMAARAELDDVDLEEVVVIQERPSKRRITDDEMVENLCKEEFREELDVLLGRKCDDTTFGSSQLARAMDTLLITTMESRVKCKSPWMISHNLQEIEHNIDCQPKNLPGRHPEMGNRQRKSYAFNNMRKTEEFIERRYRTSDVTRFLFNRGATARARWNDQTPTMRNELDYVFSLQKMYTVWGGHSIWFRHFFIEFGDLSNPVCRHLTGIKLANTAVVSVRVRRVETSSSNVGYALFDCKIVHLGSSTEYKMKLRDVTETNTNIDKVPHPSHFDPIHGIQQINGWKCCCSRSKYQDASVSILKTRKSLEICLLVKTDHCSYPDKAVWKKISNRKASYVEDVARHYHWGRNKGPCVVD